MIFLFVLFFDRFCSTTVNGVFPALIKLGVFATDVVVQHRGHCHRLDHFARHLPVVVVLRLHAHRHIVHHVLRVGVLLLPQIEHFEFLPHRRLVGIFLNCAERAQRLLDPAALLQVSKALVLFNLSYSLFLFDTKLNIVKGVVR